MSEVSKHHCNFPENDERGEEWREKEKVMRAVTGFSMKYIYKISINQDSFTADNNPLLRK